MAYLKNSDFQTLAGIWTEARDNRGRISFHSLEKLGELLRNIEQDKRESKEKTRRIIAERRKTNKQYARAKNNPNE